jgi:hypothetical protein
VPEVLRLVETAEIECRIEADTRRISYPRSGCAVAPRQPWLLGGANAFSSPSPRSPRTLPSGSTYPGNRTVIVGSHVEV